MMKKILLLMATILLSNIVNAQNNSIFFNGLDQAVNLGENYAFQKEDSFTVEAWVKVSEVGFQQIVSKLDVNFTGWGMQINDTGLLSGYLFSQWTSNIRFAEGTQIISDNEWHHVAMTWDGDNQIELYVDGVFDPLTVYTENGAVLGPIDNNSETRIGNYDGDGQPGEYLVGFIDEVRLWDFKRDAADIAVTANTEITGTETGLIGYYKMDVVDSSCDVQDCSPSELHGARWTISDGEIPEFNNEVPDITDVECGNTNTCTLGIETPQITNISLYPNPARDEFSISGFTLDAELIIEIYSVSGVTIHKAISKSKNMSIESLPSGIYFVVIQDGSSKIMKKLIKK